MAEMREPVTQHDLAWHADALELRALELADVHIGSIGPRMERHVDERAGDVFDGLEALVPALRLLQLCNHFVGNGLAGRVMQCVALEHLGLERPMLEDLRRQFDEIPQDLRAR